MLLALTLVVGVFVFSGSASASGTLDLLDYQSTVDEMLAVDPTLEPPPNNGKRDFVVGGFQYLGFHNIGVSAHSDPAGEDAWGHMSATIPENPTVLKQFRFRVTCVNVRELPSGIRVALIGAVPTEAASNDFPNESLLAWFVDGGPGGGTPAQLDRFFLRGGEQREDERCREDAFRDLALVVTQPIDRGNILIHDAAAVEQP